MRDKKLPLVFLALGVILATGTVSAQQVGHALSRTAVAAPGFVPSHNVELVGQIGGVASAIATQGDVAYLGLGPRLVCLDISAPPRLTALGQSPVLPGTVNDVRVNGDCAYVAAAFKLWVIDISNTGQPTVVGSCPARGPALGVAISGDYAYVADLHEGLTVIDIHDPAQPTLAGFVATPGLAHDVAVAGAYVYVADYSQLVVVDVSNPADPQQAAVVDTPGTATGLAIALPYAYVADGHRGLRIIDVSDPQQPYEAGAYEEWAGDVAVQGGTAYITGDVLRAIDVSDPTAPSEVGSYDVLGASRDIAVAAGHAYLAGADTGLQVFDVRDPANLVQTAVHETIGAAEHVVLAGDHAYVVGDFANGLHVLDATDASRLTELGFCEVDDAYDVVVSGQHAYVAAWHKGFHVVDVSDPSNPIVASSHSTPGYACDLALVDDHVYVADGDGDLAIFDVSDPSEPVPAPTYEVEGSVFAVAAAGDLACVGSVYETTFGSTGTLHTLDVSAPSGPLALGTCEVPFVRGIGLDPGRHAYVAAGYAGLRAIDISDPGSPTEVGAYDTPGYAVGVGLDSPYVHVADEDAGLRVINVSNPALPAEVGYYDMAGVARDAVVAANGDIYVPAGSAGLFVLRLGGELRERIYLPLILRQLKRCEESLYRAKVWQGELQWDCDTLVKVEGRSSVRLESTVPSDAELFSPLLAVLPGERYRVSYWVKTELTVEDAQVYGRVVAAQYSAQAKESDEVNEGRVDSGFALGNNLGGVSDWVQQSYTFTTAVDARFVRLRAPLGLAGRATGRVWYDGLSLVQETHGSGSVRPPQVMRTARVK